MLYSNVCSYDCSYCVNRRSNDRPRATFTPRELAELTIGFYRRNYIEGLFLSSAVLGTPDRTMELMIEALRILREEYHFNGYIHAKTIPGADPMLVEKIGRLADRPVGQYRAAQRNEPDHAGPRQKENCDPAPHGADRQCRARRVKRRWCSTAGPSRLRRLGRAPK